MGRASVPVSEKRTQDYFLFCPLGGCFEGDGKNRLKKIYHAAEISARGEKRERVRERETAKQSQASSSLSRQRQEPTVLRLLAQHAETEKGSDMQ